MSPNMAGALVGLVVGLMGYVAIRMVASRVEQNGIGSDPAKSAGVLRVVAVADLIFFVVAGYFVGPMIVDG